MKTFSASFRIHDTCGNYDEYSVGYFEAESLSDAKAKFPEKGFYEWVITEIKHKSPEDLIAFAGAKVSSGRWT